MYNVLSKSETVQKLIPRLLFRNAFIGMIASFVSDTVVNSIRVIKTTKQAMGARHTVSYLEAINMVLAADGWQVGPRKRHCFVRRLYFVTSKLIRCTFSCTLFMTGSLWKGSAYASVFQCITICCIHCNMEGTSGERVGTEY